MRSRFPLALYSARAERRSSLAEAIEATGQARVVARIESPGDLRSVVETARPGVLLVDLVEEPKATLDLVESLPAPRPVLLVSGPQDDSELILRALRLGAREFFPSELTNGALDSVFERIGAELQSSAAPTRRAPLIAVTGAKGGVGATVAACELALTLRRGGASTAVVDLNLLQGDVALYLDVRPKYTLADVGGDTADFDASYLEPILHSHRSGVSVLAAPPSIDTAHLVSGAHVERALGLLQGEFEWVILDVPSHWNDASLRALEISDLVLLIAAREVPALHHARQRLGLLDRIGIPRQKIRVISNRDSSSDPVSDRDLTKFLKSPLDASIPNDFLAVSRTLNEGDTIAETAPRGPLAAAYKELAQLVHGWCGIEVPEQERARGWQSSLKRIVGRYGAS